MQQQPVQPAASPVALDNHPLNMPSSVPAADPMARKQVVQDLMAQMQGTYNFMQVGRSPLDMSSSLNLVLIASLLIGLDAGV